STSSLVISSSSTVVTRLAQRVAMKYETTRAGIATRKPMPMTKMRLSPIPMVLAAAMGPGVGGMNTCEIYKPDASAIVIDAEAVAVRRTSARRMGFRTTNPESQNTAID